MALAQKIPWLPQPEKKAYEVMYTWRMLASYFATMFAIIAVFFIPVVQRFTGILPWEVTLVGGAHFLLGMLPQIVFRRMDTAKFVLWEIFSDRFVMSSFALFAAPDATFIWLFFSFLCIMEALIEAPSVYSAVMVFVPPAAAWGVFVLADLRPFSSHDIWVLVTISILTLIIWLFVANATAQYRGAHRDIEKSTAQAELERRRADLSRDIHDAIAAIFTRILAVQKDESGETAALTRDGLRQLRDIVTALQADNTSLGFLTSWINHYSQQYFEHTGIQSRCEIQVQSPELQLEPIQIIHVMRIYQELCQNALKHSQATEIHTSVNERDRKMILKFSDNGQGYVAAARGTDGLDNLKHRVHELGGTIEHTGNSAQGSITLVNFPVSH